MFWRLIRSALTRRRGGRVLLAATTALGASVSTAMLAVMFDVGDKVNQELSTYGANIVVQPQNAAILGQFYDLDTGVSAGPGLAENQVANVKTIFWAFNIVAFSPFLETETILNVTSGSAPHPTPTANTTSDTTTQTTPDTTAHTAETHNQHSHSDPAPASTTQTTSDTTTHQTNETHNQHTNTASSTTPTTQPAETHNHHSHSESASDTTTTPPSADSPTDPPTPPASIPEGTKVSVVGTWYAKPLHLPTGEHTEAGVIELQRWWQVTGGWIGDTDDTLALVGASLAARENINLGDTITLTPAAAGASPVSLQVAGIMQTGGEEDDQVFTTLAVSQQLANRPGEVDRIEVSALTTPENDLARRAARNPGALSVTDWETWYCTAYASSIAYQIEEVIDGAAAKPVRQITESQGMILTKTQLLMLLVTLLALLAAALGIANLVSASVMERSGELGLLKAIGASNSALVMLVLSELLVVGLVGGAVGFLAGLGAAQIIGQMVFGSYVALRGVVVALTALLVALMILLGSLPAIRHLLRLNPAEVLHGR